MPLQDQQLLTHPPKPSSIYTTQASYQDTASLYHPVQYAEPQTVPHDLQYGSVHHPVGVVDQQYTTQPTTFPTPPLQHAPQPGSPEETYQAEYAQQDLADLLGSLKVNEAGTGMECFASAK